MYAYTYTLHVHVAHLVNVFGCVQCFCTAFGPQTVWSMCVNSCDSLELKQGSCSGLYVFLLNRYRDCHDGAVNGTYVHAFSVYIDV